MNGYKPSKYNFFFTTKKGENLAFNGISGGFAYIKKDDEITVKKFIDNPNAKVESKKEEEIFNKLLQGRFILDANLNELSLLKMRFWRSRFNFKGLGITIAPTLNCNFKCIYCYERGKGAIKHIKMSRKKAEIFIKFISNQIEDGIKNISITWYGGEPLLEIKLIKEISSRIIKICEEKQVSYNAGMITNGYLLTKEKFEAILASKIKSIQITLDGPPEIHNHFRPLVDGSPTFNVILENIKRFIDFTQGKVKVAIRINIAQGNMDAPFNLIKILEKEGLKDNVSIYPGQIVSDNSRMSCLLDNTFSDIETKFIETLFANGWEIHLPPLPRGTYCGAFIMNSYTIDPQLNLYKCWEAIGVNKLKVGNIADDGKIKLNEGNLHWLSFDPFEFEECRRCKYLPLCMGGCISKTIEEKLATGVLNHGKCPPLRYNLLNKLLVYYNYYNKKRRKK